MIVSVIVIAREKTPEVQACIDSVKLSSVFAGVELEVLFSDRDNKSLARNELVKKSSGEILVFIDSDAVASDFWLHELLKPFKDPAVSVVGGPHLPRFDASYRELLADKILGFPLATWKSSSRYKVSGILREVDESELTSCNLAIRRLAFLASGGFPEDLIPCEENVVLERIRSLGAVMIYSPLAIVFHNRDPLFRPYMKKIFYYGTGRGKMIRRQEGRIRFIPGLSKDFLFLGVGLMVHYIAYIAGIIKGVLKN